MNLLETFDEEELKLINASLLPLQKKKWKFKRGARNVQHYMDGDFINAKEDYIYTWSEDKREIIDFTRQFSFLDDEGNLLFDPIDTTPDIDSLIIDEINESMRKRQLRYLRLQVKAFKEIAKTLPDGPFKDAINQAAAGVEYLLSYYSTQIIQYEKYGTTEWETAMDNETDPIIVSILNSTLRQPDAEFPNGLTGRQSINYQITGLIP